MGMLSKLGGMIPPNAAQSAADTFLMGVGGGAMGAAGGSMMGGGDAMVPGMMAGAGAGIGARGAVGGIRQLVMAVARAMKQKMPNQPDQVILQQANAVVQEAMSRPESRAQLEQMLGGQGGL